MSTLKFGGPIAIAVLVSVIFTGCMSEWNGGVNVAFKNQDTKTIVALVPEYSKITGLEAGDVLLAVDGEDVTNFPFKKIKALLHGPVGSFTELTVRRGSEVMTFEVERRMRSN